MSDGPRKTPPVEPQNYLSGVKVVDIGDLRVARGMSRRPVSTCTHVNQVYDQKERRVWCSDCETDLDPFDAYRSIVENLHTCYERIDRVKAELADATKQNLHLLAARAVEKTLRSRSMIPTCPHCSRGLTADDLKSHGAMSVKLEIARRKGEAKRKEPTHD